MKILYFEIATSGHRIPHLSAIINGTNAESILVISEPVADVLCKQYILKNKEGKERSFLRYRKMLIELADIAKKEKPDIVHFLDGNIFYRYFGFGLHYFKDYKTVLTNHSAVMGILHGISTYIIGHNVDKVVVTCQYSKDVFESYGVKNVYNFEYPHLGTASSFVEKCKPYFGIYDDIPVIGCIGGTRWSKGLDRILEALSSVHEPFHLLIAGKEEFFTEAVIDSASITYPDRVIKVLRRLTDEEFDKAMMASDIIALPYRDVQIYNGASGLLSEGVWRRKCIVAPNGDNLGAVVAGNHLGYVFAHDDINSLTNTLRKALKKDFEVDSVYEAYREQLRPDRFVENYRQLYNELLQEK